MAQILCAAGFLRFASFPRVLAPATVAVGFLLLVVDHMRPVVGCRQAESLGKPVLETSLHGVIRAVAIGRQQANAGETLIRTPRLDVSWPRIGAVEVQLAGIQERSLTADIAHFHAVVGAQLA